MITPLNGLAKACGYSYPQHWKEWEGLLANHQRLLLVATRDGGKSTLITKLYPALKAITQPGIEILLISYSEHQAIRLISGIKELFEGKELINSLVPGDNDDWSKSRLHFRNGSRINSLTFGSSGRGQHCDLIIVDDPVKDYAGFNADDQEDYFLRAVVPMARPTAQIIVTGTFVYPNDLIERIQRNRAYHSAIYPAINADGSALWPERWPLEKLQERRIEVGEYGFKREYLLEAIDPEAQFFKRSMFKFYDPDAMPELMSRAASWDPAISLNGDFNAMMCTGTDEKKVTRVLPEYAEFKSDNVQALIDEQFRLTELYDIPYWIVEVIGFQKLLKEHIYDAMREKNRHFGIKEIKHHVKSKQARIMALQPRIVAGSLLFHPTAHEDIIKQFCAFPRGAHDDMIDALASMLPDWDKPQPATKQAPPGSMEWWRSQVEEESTGWYNAIAKT